MSKTTIARTAGLGVLAAAEFATDHQLELWSITVPLPHERSLSISVPAAALSAWADAIEQYGHLTGEPVVVPHQDNRPPYETVIYTGTVPTAIGDLAVTVRGSRPVAPWSRVLSVVSA